MLSRGYFNVEMLLTVCLCCVLKTSGIRVLVRTRRALRSPCVLCLFACGAAAWQLNPIWAQAARAAKKAIIAEFAVDEEGAPLVLPIEIEVTDDNGAVKVVVFRMLLDTGASHSIFAVKHRAVLGRPITKAQMHTLGAPIEVELFEFPRMHLGSLIIRPTGHVACVDLTQSSEIVGESVDGVLGMDFLGSLVISIDFDRGRVTIHRVVDPSFGQPVRITRDAPEHPRCPVVYCKVGKGDEIGFLVDTGGTGLLSGGIQQGAYDRIVEQRQLLPEAGARNFKLPTGAAYLQYGRTTSFSAGPYVHEGLLFGRFPINCLGLGYLSRYLVAFDFPNNVMYLKPGAGFSRSDRIQVSGMRVAKRGKTVVVALVAEGGVAASAGIRRDDEIVSLDGRSVREFTIMSVRRRLCEAGVLSLGIRHCNTERRIILHLPDKIGEPPP